MLSALALSYAAAGYWYFWEVLRGDVVATRAEIGMCAILGLLFGPLLLVVGLLLRAGDSAQSLLTKALKR